MMNSFLNFLCSSCSFITSRVAFFLLLGLLGPLLWRVLVRSFTLHTHVFLTFE